MKTTIGCRLVGIALGFVTANCGQRGYDWEDVETTAAALTSDQLPTYGGGRSLTQRLTPSTGGISHPPNSPAGRPTSPTWSSICLAPIFLLRPGGNPCYFNTTSTAPQWEQRLSMAENSVRRRDGIDFHPVRHGGRFFYDPAEVERYAEQHGPKRASAADGAPVAYSFEGIAPVSPCIP
jgi:hypothetical protein